ncbi:MAG: biotin--[acetyl-CoA-carboxylase] ligase [Ferruginibacter sp.]|nr:biotin--[acetyl-CoA-carboxylase] ligase [Bacteroidota bacterium]MBX2917881.1 biotin--[acetyl-CoA-carboxylase] ligase [Ferruginibacter sp.]MCB0710310.1 biotin--[acetyl-CoA-carboxylase] ligase [Chitinophagaceae bacterium]
MLQESFFNILDTVDSTNIYAMKQIHAAMATHGMAWFAREQTAGKGQRGKSWKSEKDKNIALSLVIEPGRLQFNNQFQVSAAVALACFEFFSSYAGDETKIKWPNDLYWRDRKAGGILIENVVQGKNWKWAVVGIGININQTKYTTAIKNPVSLKQITGKDFDVIELAKILHGLLMKYITGLKKDDSIITAYNEHLYKLNHLVTLKKGNEIFDTVIKEVTATGRLVTVDAVERQFDFGEVEWL